MFLSYGRSSNNTVFQESKAGKMSETKTNTKKQVKRRWKNLKASRLTTALLSPALRRLGFVQTEIITRWPQIVGRDIADCVVPVKITFPRAARNGGTLLVRCESAFAPKLQHRIPVIIDSVNNYYGYGAISLVQIQQGPMPKKRKHISSKPLQPSRHVTRQVGSVVEKTKDDDLRQALQALGEQMGAKEESKKNK